MFVSNSAYLAIARYALKNIQNLLKQLCYLKITASLFLIHKILSDFFFHSHLLFIWNFSICSADLQVFLELTLTPNLHGHILLQVC